MFVWTWTYGFEVTIINYNERIINLIIGTDDSECVNNETLDVVRNIVHTLKLTRRKEHSR